MMAQAQIASDGKDDIRGADTAETLTGGAGADRISAGDGNDRLTGGLGDDYLIGGDGSDTYVFNIGDGRDTIRDDGFRDTDAIEFGAGLRLPTYRQVIYGTTCCCGSAMATIKS